MGPLNEILRPYIKISEGETKVNTFIIFFSFGWGYNYKKKYIFYCYVISVKCKHNDFIKTTDPARSLKARPEEENSGFLKLISDALVPFSKQ